MRKAMKPTKVLTAVLSLVLLFLSFQTSIRADEWNKKTYLTFSAPVEIPGKVLAAGTYVFKLADSNSDRHIVQIWNKDETQVITTILAIPDNLPRPADKTIIMFGENAPNAPPAVKDWFYPGDDIGQQFVYHRTRAMEVAKMCNENVLATTETSTEPEMLMKAPVSAVTPKGEDAEITSATHPKQ